MRRRALLPLDDERRAEAEVWLAFAGRALVDPGLRALRQEVDDLMRGLMQELVDLLLGPDAPDADFEAERLYALVDGLALNAIVRPERTTASVMTATLAGHLDRLVVRGELAGLREQLAPRTDLLQAATRHNAGRVEVR